MPDVQDAKGLAEAGALCHLRQRSAYFVDMVKDHLLEKYSEQDLLSSNYRVFTTLDPQLQRVAAAAIDSGMKNVDAMLAAKYAKTRKLKGKKPSRSRFPRSRLP